jgi:hypothetical protein
MQHSPSSEANRFAASQEIPRILCNPMAHDRIHLQLSTSICHTIDSKFKAVKNTDIAVNVTAHNLTPLCTTCNQHA